MAQNYIMGTASKDGIVNGFNIYKVIAESDSPSLLLSRMADKLVPIPDKVNADSHDVSSLFYQK